MAAKKFDTYGNPSLGPKLGAIIFSILMGKKDGELEKKNGVSCHKSLLCSGSFRLWTVNSSISKVYLYFRRIVIVKTSGFGISKYMYFHQAYNLATTTIFWGSDTPVPPACTQQVGKKERLIICMTDFHQKYATSRAKLFLL